MWHPDIPEEHRNKIVVGDMYELSRQLPDNCVDIIFTDPPYPQEFRYTYDYLAEVAARVLKPGAPCFVYSGNDGVPYVINALAKHLKYRATISLDHKGGHNMVWQARFIAGWKPIFVFHKGSWRKDAPIIFGKCSTGGDKRYHVWGQGSEEAVHYLKYHSKPGDVVFEPFTGGGTTPEAAMKLGRNFIAYEIDPGAANIAINRLSTVESGIYMEQMELPVIKQLSYLEV